MSSGWSVGWIDVSARMSVWLGSDRDVLDKYEPKCQHLHGPQGPVFQNDLTGFYYLELIKFRSDMKIGYFKANPVISDAEGLYSDLIIQSNLVWPVTKKKKKKTT